MGESEEELQRREAEDRAVREEVILDEDTAAGWLDCQPSDGERRPPEGDLPDNPPPPPPPSLFSRVVKALRGG
jgi:hypothetical protein